MMRRLTPCAGRTSRARLAVLAGPTLLSLASAAGCGGNVATANMSTDAAADGASAEATSTSDVGLTDSAATSGDDAIGVNDATSTAPDSIAPTDASGPTALRVANMLLPTAAGTYVSVCLVDPVSGAPSIVAGALAYQSVTSWQPSPRVGTLQVNVAGPGSDCTASRPILTNRVTGTIGSSAYQTLLLFAENTTSGTELHAVVIPDVAPGSVGGMLVRVFSSMQTSSNITVDMNPGGSMVEFADLAPGAIPTSSSVGATSPEGYVPLGGDLMTVNVKLSHGAPFASFPAGLFVTARTTVFVTGVPVGGPVNPEIVVCHDDLASGGSTSCMVVNTSGPKL